MPHHNLLIILLCLSTHFSSLPVRSSANCLTRSQPYLTSTQTYIHLNKLPPAYITSTACSRHSPTHLSLFTATLHLCGDIQPKPGPTHPANLLICTLSTRSMLTPDMLPHSTTSLTTTNPKSSHLLKHGFVAPQHLLS